MAAVTRPTTAAGTSERCHRWGASSRVFAATGAGDAAAGDGAAGDRAAGVGTAGVGAAGVGAVGAGGGFGATGAAATTATTGSAGGGGATPSRAWRSNTVGRAAGSRLKACRMSCANEGGRSSGNETVSERSSGGQGGRCVRVSTRVMPSAHTSLAAERPLLAASGGSYNEPRATPAADSPAGRIVSLASCSRSSTTSTLVGCSRPCTRLLRWRNARASRTGRSIACTSSAVRAR